MLRTKRVTRVGIAGTVAIAALLAVGALAAPAGADANGDATGVQATLNALGVPVTIPPTPFVSQPPGGQKSILGFNQSGISATVLGVASNNPDPVTNESAAAVANANALSLASAGLLASTCVADPDSTDGSSLLLSTMVAGVPVGISVPPNTNVAGIATANEQKTGSDGLTVRALHLSVPLIGDVVISQSRCSAGTEVAAAAATRGNPSLTG